MEEVIRCDKVEDHGGRENLLEAVRWWRRGKDRDLGQHSCGLFTLLCVFESHQLSDTTPGLMHYAQYK